MRAQRGKIFHMLRHSLAVASWVVMTLALKADAATGVGSRHKVDISQFPWSAIGQVNNSVGGRCTGTLVARNLALTAAHCLFAPRSGNFVRPQSVHFVLGYDRGKYVFNTVAKAFHIGPGYDPSKPLTTLHSDWAILELIMPAPNSIAPLPLSQELPVIGQEFVAAGFAQDSSHVLTITAPCVLTDRFESGTLMGICDVPKGYSGGPMINESRNRLLGVQVAIGRRGQAGTVITIPPAKFAEPIKAHERAGPYKF